MIKKLSEIKESINFRKKSPCCADCIYFNSQMVTRNGGYGEYKEETNQRCIFDKGRTFYVGKSAWCINIKLID